MNQPARAFNPHLDSQAGRLFMDNSMDYLTIATDRLLTLTSTWAGMFAIDFGRYLIAATLLSVIVLLVPRRAAIFRSMRRTLPRSGQRWYEFRHSVVTTAIFGIVGLGVFYGAQLGIFHVYPLGDEPGWLAWMATLILILVAHDAYFYWTHRWMHHPKLFRRMHGTHHRSVAPTVWAAYSFAIPETLVQAAFLPLFLLVVPTSTSVLFVWPALQILKNVVGHSGVELVPRAWLASWWGQWLTTTLQHDMHHQEGRGNYGLYFMWWDRWCGTEHPEYRARLAILVHSLGEQARDGLAIPPARSNPQSLPQTPP